MASIQRRKKKEGKASGVERSNSDRTSEERTPNVSFADFSGRWKIFVTVVPFAFFFFWFFSELLFTERQFCFRDAHLFYYPLFRQIQESLNQGILPLWDPYENLGQPLAGNPTSSVFYPFKLLFFLTAIFPDSYGICYKIYIIIHYPLAYWGMYRLGRHWNLTVSGSVFAAITYTCSTLFFFQYSNVIFLTGGAWLPWAILQGDRLLRAEGTYPTVKLSFLLALMILGGDLESAYLTGLILGILWFVYSRQGVYRIATEGTKANPASSTEPNCADTDQLTSCSGKGTVFFKLTGSGVLTLLLTAIVFVPGLDFSKNSTRSVRRAPVSIWQVPGYIYDYCFNKEKLEIPYCPDMTSGKSGLGAKIADGLLVRNFRDPCSQGFAVYSPGVSPIDFIGLLWPNLTGNYFQKSCWAEGYQNESMWNPITYIGLIPFLLAVSVLTFRRKKLFEGSSPTLEERRFGSVRFWLALLVVVSGLGMLGAYGPSWWLRLTGAFLGGKLQLGFTDSDPVGGVYWLMRLLLPGYSTFRYPVKLGIFFLLGLSILAGYGLERFRGSRRLSRWGISIIAVSFLMLFYFQLHDLREIAQIPANMATDLYAAKFAVLISLFQTIFLTGLLLFLRFRMDRFSPSVQRFVPILIIFITVFDLCFVNRGFIPLRSGHDKYETSAVGASLIQSYGTSSVAPPRCFYLENEPPALIDSLSGEERSAEFADWQEKALMPKYCYLRRIGAFHTLTTTAQSRGMFLLDNGIRYTESSGDNTVRAALAPILASLDIDYLAFSPHVRTLPGFSPVDGAILPTDSKEVQDQKFQSFIDRDWPIEVVLWKNNNRSSRVRIVRSPATVSKADNPIMKMMEDYLHAPEDALPGEYAKITEYKNERLELDILLQKDADIILAEQFWPGWRAFCRPFDAPESENRPLTISMEKNVMRRFSLPAGHYRVVMTYRPACFTVGASVSLITFIALLIGLTFSRRWTAAGVKIRPCGKKEGQGSEDFANGSNIR